MEPVSPSQVPYVPPGPRWRAQELADRFAVWRRDPRVAVAALIVVALVAGAAWYRVGSGSEALATGSAPATDASATTATTSARATAASTPPASTTTSPAASKAADAGARPVVHVAGAVNRPGVVEVAAGARVADALAAAGGQQADADIDRLNLAAHVVDGQRIFVPRVGQAVLPGVGDAPATAGSSSAGPVNLNTATAAELETLPGVGPAIAVAILQLRQKKGGFSSVNELRDVKGIGESRFADLRDHVTV